jgi:predicted nucleotidyltransferase
VTAFGLKEEVIEKIRGVFKKHPEIEHAILYGSRAKGEFRDSSDIDLTLKGAQLSESILTRVSLELDDLLLPYLIDLSIYSHIKNGDLIEHIKRVGKELYIKIG